MSPHLTSISAPDSRTDIRRSEAPQGPFQPSRRPYPPALLRSVLDNETFTKPPINTSSHGITQTEPEWGRTQSRLMSSMEGDEQRRRQYEQSNYPRGYVSDPRARAGNIPNVSNVRGAMAGNGPERLRQNQMLTSRPSASVALPAGAGSNQDVGGFSYAQGQQYTNSPLSTGSFQYQSEYSADAQRQQQFPQYTSQMVYSVPQQVSPSQTQYEQFQSRPPAGVEGLGSQVGVSQFYAPGGSSTTNAPSVTPQYSTAQFQPTLAFNPTTDLTRSTLASSYPGVEPDFQQGSGTEAAESEPKQPDRFDFFYSQYQRGLKETNENAARGRLVEAGETLLEISGWLLGNVENLELTKDNQAIHKERLKLWKNFNYCWLAFLTRQLDDSRRIQATGQSPPPGQRVLSKEALQNLGDELTRLCDGLEKSGLVDYEMGVWEEEIINCGFHMNRPPNVRNDPDVVQCFWNAERLQLAVKETIQGLQPQLHLQLQKQVLASDDLTIFETAANATEEKINLADMRAQQTFSTCSHADTQHSNADRVTSYHIAACFDLRIALHQAFDVSMAPNSILLASFDCSLFECCKHLVPGWHHYKHMLPLQSQHNMHHRSYQQARHHPLELFV